MEMRALPSEESLSKSPAVMIALAVLASVSVGGYLGAQQPDIAREIPDTPFPLPDEEPGTNVTYVTYVYLVNTLTENITVELFVASESVFNATIETNQTIPVTLEGVDGETLYILWDYGTTFSPEPLTSELSLQVVFLSSGGVEYYFVGGAPV